MTKHNKLVVAVILAIEGFTMMLVSDNTNVDRNIMGIIGALLINAAVAFAVWAAE